MAKATKEMVISDVLQLGDGVVPILRRAGMNCVGCPSARNETLEQAAVVHGMDVEGLVEEINLYLDTQ